MIEHIVESMNQFRKNILILIKWLLISGITGVVVGAVSTLFAEAMEFVTGFRETHSFMLFLLPLAGIAIVGMYRVTNYTHDRGTNMILSSVHKGEDVPLRMAPLIIISTVLSHLCGASVGREGAALQLGGSISRFLAKIIKLDDNDRKIMVMSGMAAAFAALFGTPMAAAIFAIEVVNVGVMYYAALVPSIFSALVASQFAAGMGIHPEAFAIVAVPTLNFLSAGQTLLLAVICAYISIIFCMMLHGSGAVFKEIFKNPYIRVVVGAIAIIVINLVIGTTDYLGAGIGVIDRAIGGNANWYDFIMKMFLTSLAIGCGFKGGEIVPSFFVGATLGCFVGRVIGLEPSTAAAVGMIAMFCGVTNCPISSTLIAFELFGYKAVPFFLIANSVSYLVSGYYGLYSDQIVSLDKHIIAVYKNHIEEKIHDKKSERKNN